MQSGIGYASTLNSTVFNSTPACPGCKIKYTFNGPFNNGSFSIPVYRNDSELNDNNWNFLGNPYPSAIDADLFLAMNSVIDTVDQGTIDGVIYFWSQHTPPSNGNSGNENINFPQSDYAIINASGQTAGGDGIMPERYIPSGQGFFISYSDSAVPDSVSGDIATGHVVFNNSMRVNDNNDIFFRTSYAEDNKLWLNLTSDNGVFNQILIAYVEAATQQYDGASYDTERNLSVQRFATIYSRINGQKGKEYAIQSKAPKDLSINEVIPIGLNTAISVPTLYKISIPRYEGEFFNSNPIYIKDKILNTIHNLKESDYVFTSEAGEFKNRFEIIFRKKGKPNKKVNDVENALSILKIREHQNGNLEFTLNSSNEFRNITILDMQGAVIYNLNATGNSKVFDLSNLKQTIYIAKVELTDGSIITEKVIKRK